MLMNIYWNTHINILLRRDKDAQNQPLKYKRKQRHFILSALFYNISISLSVRQVM